MKAWKLTDKDGNTHGGTHWEVGVTHTAPGTGKLCGPGWIHFYSDPLLAVLLNSIHANFVSLILWEVEVEGRTKSDHGLKFGAQRVTALREIEVPVVTTEMRVRFGILCAKAVYTDQSFQAWADAWLSGENRTRDAAADAAAQARGWLEGSGRRRSQKTKAAVRAAERSAQAVLAWAAASAAAEAEWEEWAAGGLDEWVLNRAASAAAEAVEAAEDDFNLVHLAKIACEEVKQ